MRKPFLILTIALVVLRGGLRGSSAAEEPERIKLRDYLTAARCWRFLGALKEPDLRELAEKDRAATVYRFIWWPSFHDLLCVRFVKTGEGAVVHSVKLKISEDLKPERVVARRSARLKRAHWDRIARQVAKARFWTSPIYRRNPWGGDIVDGAFLCVEGVRDGRYHLVTEHSPTGGNFVGLCQAMLFMSGIDVRKVWFEYRICEGISLSDMRPDGARRSPREEVAAGSTKK